MKEVNWRKAPCEAHNCVEVATASNGALVRDSKDPEGPILRFGRKEWMAFINGARSGQFDTKILREKAQQAEATTVFAAPVVNKQPALAGTR